jgi:S-adenosylmethionine:tRNA ribosyltransferase-isomerase
MHINDFDYKLPVELIAQKPADKRENSRLLVVHRDSGKVEHRHFYNILDYINKGDCLVLNNSKVLPARLFGVKHETGAKVEFLLIKQMNGDRWETMVKPGKRLKVGDVVDFARDFSAVIVGNGEDGTRIVDFTCKGLFLERLEELGSMPLPPYIERPSEVEDKERYQTVYCKKEGSVAAPTAGLHFTEELLCKAKEKGVLLAYVTLHVGIGTFRPVNCSNIEDHHMHFEEFEISVESAEMINNTKMNGGRIISVGTTSTRTLESAAFFDDNQYIIPSKEHCMGETDIFIYPGYKFKIIDSLITNFHLPKSTLLMLISALYNREDIMRIYEIAVAEKYNFFSYGDAMLII